MGYMVVVVEELGDVMMRGGEVEGGVMGVEGLEKGGEGLGVGNGVERRGGRGKV